MIYVFYTLAILLIFLSYRSFRGGIGYLRYFREELSKPLPDYTPFTTIFAPCRGIDDGMRENLEALLGQDFPAYEVVFVVDDEGDPAVGVISDVLNRKGAETRRNGESLSNANAVEITSSPPSASQCLSGKTRLIIAPKTTDSSQKVENLREAVLHADPESGVFVFVDSDARPSATWLRSLVAPLENDAIGATTGYRWFISKRRNFGSEMNSAWNASIASALGPNTRSNFCWGGSMAVRRDVFERLDIREQWRGTLSDDFAVTRAMNEAGLPIVFVPQALTASVEDCTFAEMLEFTTRQMKITRVYATPLWIISFVGSGLFNVVLISSFFIAILSRTNSFAVWFGIATLVLVSFFSVGKAWLRLLAVRLALPQYEQDLRRQIGTQNTLWLLTPLVFFYNSAAALISRKMTWRGIRYRLKSPRETVIIAD